MKTLQSFLRALFSITDAAPDSSRPDPKHLFRLRLLGLDFRVAYSKGTFDGKTTRRVTSWCVAWMRFGFAVKTQGPGEWFVFRLPR